MNNQIPIGIVGLNFGRYILDELQQEPASRHVTLAAVCDLDTAKAQQVATERGVKAYADLDLLLKDPTIPAIGLFTSPVGRAGLIRKIVRAGKHVLTTKPFELDPAAALDVLQEASRLGRVVHLNSPAPVLPADLAVIQRWRAQYDLGRPVGAHAETWMNYHEQADGRWYDDPRQCPVAPIFRLGIYMINDLVRLFGEAETVQVLQSRIRTGRPTADNAQLGIRFRNGVLANIYASFCVGDGDYEPDSLVLKFENGTIYRNCGPTKPVARTSVSLVMAREWKRQCVETVTLDTRSGGYQWSEFQRACRGEQLPDAIQPEQIVAGLRIVTAMVEAERTNGIVGLST